jgi:glycosyltransferase involved in cell wall biosynthesis
MSTQQDKKQIIAVVNKITITSMPVNEFALFRQRNYGEEAKVLTINKIDDELKDTFSSIETYSFKRTPKQFIKTLLDSSKDIIHIHQVRSGLMLVVLTKILPRKFNIVITVHNNFTKFNPISRLIILFNSSTAKAIGFGSKASYESFPKFFKKLWKQKIYMIPNGVDIPRIDKFIIDENISKTKTDKIELVSVGRLYKHKNHEQLLRIMARLPDNYHLNILGEGVLKDHLLELIYNLGISNKVTMKGLVPRTEMYRLFINADIFIHTSHWEGMPISVLEAMACRVPILLSDIPPHREIENKSTDKLVCVSDDDYIDTILEYSKYTEDKLKNMGDRNREIVEEFYSLDFMHKEYNKVYDNVLLDNKEKI